MTNKIKAVVLAAGKSTRMKSEKTKVLHKILGKEIINYLLDSLVACGIAEQDIIVVVGDNRAEIAGAVKRKVAYAVQQEQLGTAHALLAAQEYIARHDGELLVVVGDNPYITADALQKLIASHRQGRAQCTFISAVFPGSPPPYGRVIRDEQGEVRGVVEEKDASPEQRQIREVNASIYLFDNRVVFPLLAQDRQPQCQKRVLSHRYHCHPAAGKFHRCKRSRPMIALSPSASTTAGSCRQRMNKFNRQIQQRLMLENGVTILQPETVTIEHDVEIGLDTIIYPCTYLAAGTRIGKNCVIGPFVYLKNVRVNDGEKVIFEKREA